MFLQLSEREEYLGKQLVDIAYRMHKDLGPGLLESIYIKCFCHELAIRNIKFQKQKSIAIEYQGLRIENGLFIDLLIEDLIVIELKAQELYHPVWEAQVLSYLKFSEKRLGFLINFRVPLIKNGIKRYVI